MHFQENKVTIEVPKYLIDKYVDDFKGLVGGKDRDSVYSLRDAIDEVMDMMWQEPELMEDPEYKSDVVKAIAMKESLIKLGIYYDA
jgi:hypothetical protein